MSCKIAIIGGGSLYTLPLLKTLCVPNERLPISEVVLFDRDPDRQQPRLEAAEIMLKTLNPTVKISASQTVEDAVRDADYVLIQIRTGGLSMRVQDESIPLFYGCPGQETCGPGGLMYGMRSIPDTLDLVRRIRESAPSSWIVNFSNPASILAEATRRYFPGDSRLVYLCDMTVLMLHAFEEELELPADSLEPRYFGLNHFGWFTHLYDTDGNDRIAEVRNNLMTKEVVPQELKGDPDWVQTFHRLGKICHNFSPYIPNTYLEYYFYQDEILAQSDPYNTRAHRVIQNKKRKVEQQCQNIISSNVFKGNEIGNAAHGTYILRFLEATRYPNENHIFLIPVVNEGVIPNLSPEATVEIPCVVGHDGIRKLFVGDIGPFYKGLLETQYASERLVTEGVLENNLEKCVQGFTLNRTVPNVNTAKALLKHMLEENKMWLPNLYDQARRLL